MKKGAIGIVFSQDRTQILLIKRRDIPIWVLPGGGIEELENPECAVERELFEETGIKVLVTRPVGIYTPVNRLAQVTFVFECTPQAPVPAKLSPQEETQEVAFFPITHLPKPFFFLHTEWIEDALLNEPEPIIRPMKSISWWALLKNTLRHPILIFRYLLSRLGIPFNQ
jgi:8-oxo-dGTP diphosphatase